MIAMQQAEAAINGRRSSRDSVEAPQTLVCDERFGSAWLAANQNQRSCPFSMTLEIYKKAPQVFGCR
jgi:hypothetical protein